SSMKYEVNNLQTAILWNNNGSFELSALPKEAQFSPVFGIIADDLDGDGIKDIWLGGNFYELKPQAGRHNASKGVFLKGKGNRMYTYLSPADCGIKVEGEVRDAGIIQSKDSKHLLIGRNNENVLLFRKIKK
ncbi:MAG: FG-GAP repeat domain-containing protein, partial [Chitinophagaceae bacterium]